MSVNGGSGATFEEQDIVSRVEQLSPDELDSLPFGVIKLDASGKVSFFSETEAEHSGYGDRPAIGRPFFTEIAPCMGSPDFLRRYEQAHTERTLDVLFEHVGDFADRTRVLTIRLKPAGDGGTWLFLKR